MKRLLVSCFFLLFLLSAFTAAQDVASFEKHITVKKLENGLTVLVMERPEAPVFSFFTHVDAGSTQDPLNETGLAHMMEHMAFKGTTTIGTKNYAAERVALDKVETAYAAYNYENNKRLGRDEEKVKQLEKVWQDAIAAAQQYVIVNQFGQIVESNGGEGMNAFTNTDETGYHYSMPANRFQLWAYLESDRFLHPVMREFYKERNVVMEERRMRVDNYPVGRLVEQFTAQSFSAHEYHRPTVGWSSDINNLSASDAANFFHRYYVPSNMVLAIVGDIKAAQAMPIIEKYFGRLPVSPKPEEITTREPPQNSVREVVRDKKIASFSAGFSGLPGVKYPHLFAFFGVPLPGHKPQEIADAIHAEIDRLKTQDVSDDELKMVKTRAKANLIRGLADNSGLAQELAVEQARYGDWRELFGEVDRIEKVTKADIRRVANKTFVQNNRTVGIIETKAPPANGALGGAR